MTKTNQSDDQFVVAWQESATLAEASKRVAMEPRAASLRAFRLRELGVPLRKFVRGVAVDVEGLTELARKTAQKESKR